MNSIHISRSQNIKLNCGYFMMEYLMNNYAVVAALIKLFDGKFNSGQNL